MVLLSGDRKGEQVCPGVGKKKLNSGTRDRFGSDTRDERGLLGAVVQGELLRTP